MGAKEEWESTPVLARVALIKSVVPETQTEVLRNGSKSWDQVPDSLKELLGPLLMPDTVAEDRTVHAGWSGGKPVYRASMAGRCLKELYLWRVGAGGEFDGEVTRDAYRDKGLLAANEGNIHESLVVESLRGEGYEIINAGDDQDQLEARYKRFVVRSHPDGLIRGMELGPRWHVLECKALSEDRFNLWKSEGWTGFKNYAYQVSLEMFLASKKYDQQVKCLFVVKNRNTGETLRTIIEVPPVLPATIINKFSGIEDLVESEEALGVQCDPDAEWYFCPFLGKGHCDAVKGKSGEVDVIEDEEFEATLKEFRGVKEALKELESRESALKSFIKEKMVLGPAVRVGNYIAKLSSRTREGYNKEAALGWIDSHGGDSKEFKTETHYVELRVTGGKVDNPARTEGD